MDTPGAAKDRSRFATIPDLEPTGFLQLKPYEGPMPEPQEWESLEYVDWKSGGDTNFAILASANGDNDPRGFWEHGKPDKDGMWTPNVERIPAVKKWVENVGANFGRVRIIKLEPSDQASAVQALHPDDNNRITPEGTGWVVRAWLQLTDNPESHMLVREEKEDEAGEARIPLPRGAQFLVDSERLWHAVWHDASKYGEPRYAVIASFESGPQLQSWIDSQRP